MKTKGCLTCKQNFTRPVWRKAQYCSHKCKANTPWNKGKKMPEITGGNHYLWVADRTKLKTDRKQSYDIRYREWSRTVKNRDGWKCKISNDDCAGRLESHHILGWRDHPELRYEVNNGITLCLVHHPRKRSDEQRLVPTFQELVSVNIN